jgi:hypothetical protein
MRYENQNTNHRHNWAGRAVHSLRWLVADHLGVRMKQPEQKISGRQAKLG